MKTLFSLFCLVTYLTCALSANGWPISIDMACNKALSAVACSFEFTNNANEDLYLLKRNTPLEGLDSEFVSVSLDGRPLDYEGFYMYHLPPAKDEFVLLKAGESISATVQITDVFSIDTDGLYTVQYSRPLQYLSVNEMSAMSIDDLKELAVRESIHIHLENTHLLLKPKKEEIKPDYTVHLQDCGTVSFANGDRKNSETLEAHKRLCPRFDKLLKRNNLNSDFQKWFGAISCSRAGIVQDTYKSIRSGLSKYSLTYFNREWCKSYVVAFTVLSYSYSTVYLCEPFFNLELYCVSTTGISKEDVLVHEWSHALGRRRDRVYGRKNCEALAKSNPDKAVENADTYAYYYCDTK
ncbi:PREDICTED: uncharacterized protein LOC105313773 [Amphimedon queenslandica]|uniref:Lysine-specific metallo-endopeptidase domain-containing protein n=1 Tax=Amphimedon queenslandica TaxID=400682 RepID=A0A1X7U8S1_AMPQE|nr:PREDICTED: uncharacterized protein LOC105313773 [Amphimedon queenslandica]|eukprot:XP_011405771.2 PREDICTED: uncharacterized protein LOC105313773 [Amphimedon queenslandica]